MTDVGSSPEAPTSPIRWVRLIAVVLAAILTLWSIAVFVSVASGAAARGEVGYDANFYAWLGTRFVQTGVMYSPEQLTGPYPGVGLVNLYPPVAMYLFVPFSFLPVVLWWIVPVAVIGWHLWRCRPTVLAWPVLALIAGLPSTAAILVYGNAALVSAAIVAIACHHPIAAPALVFRPTDLVAAIVVGRRWREALVGAALVGIASLPLAFYWRDWIIAIDNLDAGALRNLPTLPFVLAPAVVWWARRREPAEAEAGVASEAATAESGSGEPGLG